MENSYRSSSVHSGVCRHGQDDLLKINEHQKWERKVTYVTLNVAWLLVADGFAWAFQNCWSAGIFPHSHPFTENGQKISSDLHFLWENTSLGSVVDASCWPEGNSNSSNRSFQRRYAEERLWLCMLKQAGCGWRRPHRLPPLSAKTGNCSCSSHRLTRMMMMMIADWKNVVWSDESWLLPPHSNVSVRQKQYQLVRR